MFHGESVLRRSASSSFHTASRSSQVKFGFLFGETKYKKKIRTINLPHTSGQLLFTFDSVLVSKTGLTSSAGWCVGMVVEQHNQKYVVVVLGSRNKRERLETVKNIRYNHIVDTNLNQVNFSTNY